MDKRYSLDEMIYEGKGLMPCKWHIHATKWLENPYAANIIYIKYEDLLTNSLHEINRLCEFVNIKREQPFLEDLVEGCSFDNMRKKEVEQGWDNKNWKPENFFVRKGKIGDFVNEISQQNLEKFNNEAYIILKHFNYI